MKLGITLETDCQFIEFHKHSQKSVVFTYVKHNNDYFYQQIMTNYIYLYSK